MIRCMDCNSLLTKDEKVCAECGSEVPTDNASPSGIFSRVVNVVFYCSLAYLFTALFFSNGPNLTVSVFLTCGLLFLQRTAKDGAQQQPRKR